MAGRDLRTLLLSKIISSDGLYNYKYSSSYNALKSVVFLENKDKTDKLPTELFKKFKDIENMTNNLDIKLKDFPLIVIEEYFLRNSSTLDKYIYIQYQEKDVTDTLQVIDLYVILEKFFEKIYMLSVEIADFYSLDVKLKSNRDSKVEMF